MQKNKKQIIDLIAKTNPGSILAAQNRKYVSLSDKRSFRIMSYNMLADSNIEPYLFKGRDLSKIKASIRFAFLEKEIKEVGPDILCCQEVDSCVVEELRTMLNYRADETFYKMKLGMNKQDGVVIFFDSKKFSLKRRLYLNMFIGDSQNYGFKDILAKEMYYPSMALFAVLERTEGEDAGRNILVVNTHLLFNKNRGHVKLGMIVMMLKSIEAIKAQHNIKDVFVCGDFNLVPNSMLYEYLSTGNIDLTCGLKQYSNQHYIMNLFKNKSLTDIIKIADQKFKAKPDGKDDVADKTFLNILAALEVQIPKDNGEEITFTRKDGVAKLTTNQLEQIFEQFSLNANFKSSYSMFNNAYSESHTNKPDKKSLHFLFDAVTHNNDCYVSQYAQDMAVPVDFVWYSNGGSYVPVGILQSPEPAYLSEMRVRCPIDEFGSDHFSVVVDFQNKI